MIPPLTRPSRRAFIGTVVSSAAFFTTRGLFAEQLALTPSRTEGPFLSGQTAAGYRQRPDHRQRRHHAGGGRNHAS